MNSRKKTSSKFLVLFQTLAALVFGNSIVKAVELPDYVLGYYRKPVRICGSNGVDECTFKYDTIAIERRNFETVYVGIDITNGGGHGCNYYAIGRWAGGEIYAKMTGGINGRMCRVSIRIESDGSASFRALDGINGSPSDCNINFCSARGDMIDGSGFTKHERRH